VKVNIHEAKGQLSRLIERALKGEEVTIAKAGHPLVRLIPIHPAKPVLGSARGGSCYEARLGRADDSQRG
jgi:prevent-host-death family protein